MINWKYCLIMFILIEIIYRLSIFYNTRLSHEPFYITIMKCPNKFPHIKYYFGSEPKSLIEKLSNWFKILFQCRIFEFNFYLSSIIRSLEIILFITLLIDIIC